MKKKTPSKYLVQKLKMTDLKNGASTLLKFAIQKFYRFHVILRCDVIQKTIKSRPIAI